MDVGRCMTIKPSISIPSYTFLLHCSSNRTNNFKIISGSLSFPVYHSTANSSSRLVPVLGTNNKQNVTCVSFQCRCTKEDKFTETKTFGADLGLWKQCVSKMLAQWSIWMLKFLRPIKDAISEVVKWVVVKWVVVKWLVCKAIISLRPRSLEIEPRDVLFGELMGVDDVILVFKDILLILQGASYFEKLRNMLPQGVLLYGPQGTGKSTLVHALAREAKASFFPISAWDIANGDVSIEKLFRKARICSPSVVFIEDIDVIAKNPGDNQSWPEITLSDPAITKLHMEMDKCVKDGSMVVVIASTNKQETLDPYLFESPWFNRLFHVAKPDEDCRRKAFGLYLKDYVKEEDKEAICDFVASLTPDVVWDHLQLIANISITDAVWLEDRHVTKDDALQAIKGSVLLFPKDGPTT